jgi:hypothetical protein
MALELSMWMMLTKVRIDVIVAALRKSLLSVVKVLVVGV